MREEDKRKHQMQGHKEKKRDSERFSPFCRCTWKKERECNDAQMTRGLCFCNIFSASSLHLFRNILLLSLSVSFFHAICFSFSFIPNRHIFPFSLFLSFSLSSSVTYLHISLYIALLASLATYPYLSLLQHISLFIFSLLSLINISLCFSFPLPFPCNMSRLYFSLFPFPATHFFFFYSLSLLFLYNISHIPFFSLFPYAFTTLCMM